MKKTIGLLLCILAFLAGVAHAQTAKSVEADFNGKQMPLSMVGPHNWYATQTFLGTATFNGASVRTGNVTGPIPAEQTIGAGGTIAADACGGFKRITAAGGVTTDTTDSFTAPSTALTGCCMTVFNSGGTNTITIDGNSKTILVGAAATLDVTAYDAVTFCCDGTAWRQVTALLSNN